MKFFFTFGGGMPYRHNYVEVWAPDEITARNMMIEAHAQRWAFQYTEKEFEGQIERWGLTRLSWLNISPKNGLTICELPS
jgi:hypothetical protein